MLEVELKCLMAEADFKFTLSHKKKNYQVITIC